MINILHIIEVDYEYHPIQSIREKFSIHYIIKKKK